MNGTSGDVFSEVLIKRKMIMTNYLIIAVLILTGFVATAAIMLFIPGFLILAVAVWFGVYFGIRMQKVEFEYIFTSGDLDIDQITGNFKRKRKLEVTKDTIEIVAPENSHELDDYRNQKCKEYDFSSRDKQHKKYVCYANVGNERARIIFEPTEKMLDNMWKYSPRKVKKY